MSLIGSNSNGLVVPFNCELAERQFLTLNDNFDRTDNAVIGTDGNSGYEWNTSFFPYIGLTDNVLTPSTNGFIGRGMVSLQSTVIEFGAFGQFTAGSGDDSDAGEEWIGVSVSMDGGQFQNALELRCTRTTATLTAIVTGTPETVATVSLSEIPLDTPGELAIRRESATNVTIGLPDGQAVSVNVDDLEHIWGRAVLVGTYQTDDSSVVLVNSAYAIEPLPLDTEYLRRPIDAGTGHRAVAENLPNGFCSPMGDVSVLTSGTVGIFPGCVIPPHKTVSSIVISTGTTQTVDLDHGWFAVLDSNGAVIAVSSDNAGVPYLDSNTATTFLLTGPVVTGEQPMAVLLALGITADTMGPFSGVSIVAGWRGTGISGADGAAVEEVPDVGDVLTAGPLGSYAGAPYITLV